jgi:hypothetical protein
MRGDSVGEGVLVGGVGGGHAHGRIVP